MALELAERPTLSRWKHLIKGDFWGSGWDDDFFMDDLGWRAVALSQDSNIHLISVNKLEWPAGSIEFGHFFKAWRREGGKVEGVDADLIWERREMASKVWKANQTQAAIKKAWE